jgi:hypothetical protein
MDFDPEAIRRRNFGDLAKLANAPSPTAGAERDEGSGLIHLATLEAAEGSTSTSSEHPVVRVAEAPREISRLRAVASAGTLLGVLVLGAFLGSVGPTVIRWTGAAIRAVPAPIPQTVSNASAPRRTSEVESLKLPLRSGDVEVAETAAVVVSSPVTGPSEQGRSLAQDPPPPSAHAASTVSTSPAQAAHAERLAGPTPETGKAARSEKSLGEQIEEAAGSDQAPSPGASSNEDTVPTNPDGVVPVYPSLGAIHSALARALHEAQACVEGDVPISHARVTFNSTGTVEDVTVTGWAAGKPAEACVRNALTKPRVAPFLQPTYAVPVTIRSN